MKHFWRRCYFKFKYAIRGWRYIWRQEISFRVEIILILCLMLYAWYSDWAGVKWAALILLSVLILVAETVNTVLERVLDLFEPRLSSQVAQLKDILAGAVFWLVIATLIIMIILIKI